MATFAFPAPHCTTSLLLMVVDDGTWYLGHKNCIKFLSGNVKKKEYKYSKTLSK